MVKRSSLSTRIISIQCSLLILIKFEISEKMEMSNLSLSRAIFRRGTRVGIFFMKYYVFRRPIGDRHGICWVGKWKYSVFRRPTRNVALRAVWAVTVTLPCNPTLIRYFPFFMHITVTLWWRSCCWILLPPSSNHAVICVYFWKT